MELYDSEGNEVDYDDDYSDDEVTNPSNTMVKLIKNEGPEMQYLSYVPYHLGRYVKICSN